MAKSCRCCGARILRWWANFACGGAGITWCRMKIASGNGSRFRKGMEFPKKKASANRVGAREVEVKTVADLDGMIVNAEILDFGRRRSAHRTRHGDPRESRRFRGRRRDSDPRRITFRTSFPRMCWSRRGRFRVRSRRRRSQSGGIFERSTSSRSMAKRRAISTTRFGWRSSRTGTSRCRFISPT